MTEAENNHNPVAPQLSLNGSAPEALLTGYVDALRALSDAAEALGKTAPHPRDYQHQPEMYRFAREQHTRRIQDLARINADLTMLAESVMEAAERRRRRA